MDPYFDLDKNVNFKNVFGQVLIDALGYKRMPVFLNTINIFDAFEKINDEDANKYINNMPAKEKRAVEDLHKSVNVLNIPRFYMILNNNGITDRLTIFQMLLYLTQGTTLGGLYQCIYYNIIPENIYFGGIKTGSDGLRFTVESSIKPEYFGTDEEKFKTGLYGSTILIKDDEIIQTSSRTHTLSYILNDIDFENRFGVANVVMTCRIDYKNKDVNFLWKINWRNDAIKNFMDLIKKLHERSKAVNKSLLTIMCNILFKDTYIDAQQQDIVNVFEGICVKYSDNNDRLKRLTSLKEQLSVSNTDVSKILTKYQKDYPYKLSDPHISELISNQMNKVGDYIESGICGQLAKCPEISDKKENATDTDTDTDTESDEDSSQDNALPKNNDSLKQPYDPVSSELKWTRNKDGTGWTSEQEPPSNFKPHPPSSVPPAPLPGSSTATLSSLPSSPPQSQQPLVTQSTEGSDFCLKNEEERACKERLLQRRIDSIKSTLNEYKNNKQYESMMTNINNINVADVVQSELKIKQIEQIIRSSDKEDDKIANINRLFRRQP